MVVDENCSVPELSEGTPSVLIVDDNPLIVSVLESLFRSEKFEVNVASNGEEAIELIRSHPVDVIVCDVMMPRMDGYALHAHVRGVPEYAHIPFIFLTALGDRREVERGHESGADDYLVKPFDPRQMLALVRGKVQRGRQMRRAQEEQLANYRKKVIHTLSHEFRTPLVAINTGVELLLDHKHALSNDRVHHLLEAIQRGGERLERMVNDFMTLQQFEAGTSKRMFDSRACKLRFADVAAHLTEAEQGSLVTAGYHFESHIEVGEECVFGYEPQLLDIGRRLLQNAVKFGGDAKRVELHAYPRGGHVVLEVRDRGIGMDVARVTEALALFGQIDRQKLEQQGGGLGLAICERFAKLHAGHLEFDNREGGGTVARVVIPVM